ncbi:hypothetical protein ACO0LB_17995 [Undibacterium sp. SXout7W]|uniref:hypothetical protein n=1 Tax=Undibacterium sp. SXout7W TaxID=3413049 RepID=UPI003BF01105
MNTQSKYKDKASRLRASLKAVLGIDCKVSQSLEIIAHTENYPTWDALSGVAKKVGILAGTSIPRIIVETGQIKDLMDLYKKNTGLILVSGLTGTGKSSLMDSTFRNSFANNKKAAVFLRDSFIDLARFSVEIKRDARAAVFIDELREIDVYWPPVLSLLEAGRLVAVSIYSSNTEQFIRQHVPESLIISNSFLWLHLVRPKEHSPTKSIEF